MTCPICRDTGIASKSPYIMGTSQGDIYTMTACTCPAGQRLVKATQKDEVDDH